MSAGGGGFVPPPYPYDRLKPLEDAAARHEGGIVDLSIGTPYDAPPDAVVDALATSGVERGYPPSIGGPRLREAAAGWMQRRLACERVPDDSIAACVGTKEFVATLPQWLKLRTPERDTVLYPAISYPTYEMGAILAGLRAVPYLSLDDVSDADARRALLVWVNTPANPTGELADLGAASEWGRARGVPVFSDECYVEFTWDGPRHTILEHGLDGVVAVHSLSKRSNAAGLRVGFYAGDRELVHYLREVRKHVGMMVPGPVQAAAVVALDDDVHVDAQRQRYLERLEVFAKILAEIGVDAPLPGGAFYLWVPAPDGDAWAFAERLAVDGGCLVSPGEFYGRAGAPFVRIAMVQPLDRLRLVGERLRATA
jgi:succinyldiaminopimelate transaminase